MIKIENVLLDRIRVNAEYYYPNECCGMLIGTAERIMEIWPAANETVDMPQRRYVISPLELLKAENYARGRGMEVVGIYHSHPDHPSCPSEYDREHAIPHYLYLIVNVAEGRAGEVTVWRLEDWDSGWIREKPLTVEARVGLEEAGQ